MPRLKNYNTNGKVLFFFIVFFLIVNVLFVSKVSAKPTFYGNVLDKDTGIPINGVNVWIIHGSSSCNSNNVATSDCRRYKKLYTGTDTACDTSGDKRPKVNPTAVALSTCPGSPTVGGYYYFKSTSGGMACCGEATCDAHECRPGSLHIIAETPPGYEECNCSYRCASNGKARFDRCGNGQDSSHQKKFKCEIEKVCGDGVINVAGETCDPPGLADECGYDNCQADCTCPVDTKPTVTITGPGNCNADDTVTFSATATELNTVDEVQRINISLEYNSFIYAHQFRMDEDTFFLGKCTLAGVCTESTEADWPFDVTPMVTIPSAAKSVTVTLTIDDLGLFGDEEYGEIKYFARAKDKAGWGGRTAKTTIFEEWYEPSATVSATADYSDPANPSKIDLTYLVSHSKGNCDWKASSLENNTLINSSDWPNISTTYSSVLGTGACSGTTSFSPAPDDTYKFEVRGKRGECNCLADGLTDPCYEEGSNSVTAVTPTPWLLTGRGDSYVYGGISSSESLQIYKLTDTTSTVPTAVDDEAYFSTYINSKKEGSFPISELLSDIESRDKYKLDIYDDSNIEKVGSLSLNNYIREILTTNQCPDSACIEVDVSSDPIVQPATSCVGKKIYLVNNAGGNVLSFDSDFTSGATDACVFLISGNVEIDSSVSTLNTFFLVDGKFTTESAGSDSDNILFINGGVIANAVNFQRDLSNDFLNPAELIEYNPKYIDLLRSYLGEKYFVKIREQLYSSPK